MTKIKKLAGEKTSNDYRALLRGMGASLTYTAACGTEYWGGSENAIAKVEDARFKNLLPFRCAIHKSSGEVAFSIWKDTPNEEYIGATNAGLLDACQAALAALNGEGEGHFDEESLRAKLELAISKAINK